MNPEKDRLVEAQSKKAAWKKWGPYLSERQWGTVREDYSESGDAWNFFPHDHARSRAYQWGEDGLAGISDEKQHVCFALGLWNGKDPIIKERLFGLAGPEGNHGEDVKEYYFYLDSTPTHSYMKYLYKYPQAAYPYDHIVATNREAGRGKPEYELLDTGMFNKNAYFDVFVEYAKAISGRPAHSDHCSQPGHPVRHARTFADPVVSQRLVLGRRGGTALPAASVPGQSRGVLWPFPTGNWGTGSFTRKGLPNFCLPKTKPTRSGCGDLPTRRPT
jgi:hypothetical protein